MSNTINKRLFGSPIPDNVKEILKYRQGDTYNEAKIGDSISQNLTQPFRMDDKTPFVRMWTSVKLMGHMWLIRIKNHRGIDNEIPLLKTN